MPYEPDIPGSEEHPADRLQLPPTTSGSPSGPSAPWRTGGFVGGSPYGSYAAPSAYDKLPNKRTRMKMWWLERMAERNTSYGLIFAVVTLVGMKWVPLEALHAYATIMSLAAASLLTYLKE